MWTGQYTAKNVNIRPPRLRREMRRGCPPGSFPAPPKMRQKLLAQGYLEYPPGCFSKIVSVTPAQPAVWPNVVAPPYPARYPGSYSLRTGYYLS